MRTLEDPPRKNTQKERKFYRQVRDFLNPIWEPHKAGASELEVHAQLLTLHTSLLTPTTLEVAFVRCAHQTRAVLSVHETLGFGAPTSGVPLLRLKAH